MKKPNKSPEYLAFQKRKLRKILKRRRKAKARKKYQRLALQGKNLFEQKSIKEHWSFARVKAPKVFAFLDNTEETTKFINELEFQLEKGKPVFVDLEKVETLDYAAITVLLSVMFIFQKRRIKFDGNYPTDAKIREKLVDSQFFERLSKRQGGLSIKKENQIFGKGNKVVEPSLGYNVMIQASETIWKSKRMCKGLQRVLLELMQNTHNHALSDRKGEEYWWLSVNHDPANKRVMFGFVDYGQGIFKSLNNKPTGSKWSGYYEKIKTKLKHGNNAEILQKLLEGELHATVTGQSFRGKGLPGIRQVMKRNQISNLHIISNDVYSDVQKDKYNIISKAFSGTFIYWELCYNNANTLWNI